MKLFTIAVDIDHETPHLFFAIPLNLQKKKYYYVLVLVVYDTKNELRNVLIMFTYLGGKNIFSHRVKNTAVS